MLHFEIAAEQQQQQNTLNFSIADKYLIIRTVFKL